MTKICACARAPATRCTRTSAYARARVSAKLWRLFPQLSLGAAAAAAGTVHGAGFSSMSFCSPALQLQPLQPLPASDGRTRPAWFHRSRHGGGSLPRSGPLWRCPLPLAPSVSGARIVCLRGEDECETRRAEAAARAPARGCGRG